MKVSTRSSLVVSSSSAEQSVIADSSSRTRSRADAAEIEPRELDAVKHGVADEVGGCGRLELRQRVEVDHP